MLLASSGRDNFADLALTSEAIASATIQDRALATSRDVMLAMLLHEAEMRESSSVQRLLGDHGPSHGEAIYSALQSHVALQAGFSDPLFGRDAIRAAATLFPGDEALLRIPVYRRFNCSAQCNLSVDAPFPDVELLNLTTLAKDEEPCWQRLSEIHRGVADSKLAS